MIVYYLMTLLAVFYQGVSDWLWWVALVVVAAATRKIEAIKIYTLAFFAGVFFDLMMGRNLGLTAVYLLFVCALIRLLGQRFELNWQWAAGLIIISQLLWRINLI